MVVSNVAQDGGGIYAEGGTTNITNSVIAENIGTNSGGGIRAVDIGGPTVNLAFTAIKDNQSGNGAGIDQSGVLLLLT